MHDLDLPCEQPASRAPHVPDRAHLASMVDRHLAACRRSGATLAVLSIGLDGLADAKEWHGVDAVDQWLDKACLRVKACIRGADILTRLGKDELVAVLLNVAVPAVVAVEARLNHVLRSPCRIGARVMALPACIGAAVYPRAGDSGEALVLAADRARHLAENGRSDHCASAFQHQPVDAHCHRSIRPAGL